MQNLVYILIFIPILAYSSGENCIKNVAVICIKASSINLLNAKVDKCKKKLLSEVNNSYTPLYLPINVSKFKYLLDQKIQLSKDKKVDDLKIVVDETKGKISFLVLNKINSYDIPTYKINPNYSSPIHHLIFHNFNNKSIKPAFLVFREEPSSIEIKQLRPQNSVVVHSPLIPKSVIKKKLKQILIKDKITNKDLNKQYVQVLSSKLIHNLRTDLRIHTSKANILLLDSKIRYGGIVSNLQNDNGSNIFNFCATGNMCSQSELFVQFVNYIKNNHDKGEMALFNSQYYDLVYWLSIMQEFQLQRVHRLGPNSMNHLLFL